MSSSFGIKNKIKTQRNIITRGKSLMYLLKHDLNKLFFSHYRNFLLDELMSIFFRVDYIIATRLTAIKKRESLNGKREERERENVSYLCTRIVPAHLYRIV